MTLPANVDTATVTGTFINLADGNPATGTVTFEPAPTRLADASADVILLGGPVVAELDAEGHFELTLAATDDVDMNPVGWTYLVTVKLTDPARGWRFAMSAPAGETVDLADVVPIETTLGGLVVVTGPEGPVGPPGPPSTVPGPQGPPGQWVSMTFAEFEALPTKDPDTLYVIVT